MRRFSEANKERLAAAIEETLQGVARAHGVEVIIDFKGEYPLTVNTAAEVDFGAAGGA